MLSLSVKTRKTKGRGKAKEESFPAVLYGPKIENRLLEVDSKKFDEIYKKVGENTLISLELKEGEKYVVLIHEVQRDPLTGKFTHVDFYQPSLEKEMEARIPVLLEGESPAVKDLGGTLIKNVQEVHVKALPQNLPREIKISIEDLKTFEDHIKIKDLKVGEGVKIQGNLEDIVVSVVPPEKVEEELEKPIEEKVEEVERVEKEKKEEEEEEPEKEEQEAPKNE